MLFISHIFFATLKVIQKLHHFKAKNHNLSSLLPEKAIDGDRTASVCTFCGKKYELRSFVRNPYSFLLRGYREPYAPNLNMCYFIIM